MNITWPTTPPLPSVEGYGLTPQEAVLRTDMESAWRASVAGFGKRPRVSPCAGSSARVRVCPVRGLVQVPRRRGRAVV